MTSVGKHLSPTATVPDSTVCVNVYWPVVAPSQPEKSVGVIAAVTPPKYGDAHAVGFISRLMSEAGSGITPPDGPVP